MSNSRRDFIQGGIFASLPFLVPYKPSIVLPLNGLPLPEFNIGDLVASDWIDEFDKEVTDFGKVVGLCYLPECKSYFRERNCLSVSEWAYYIYWTHSSSGPHISFPCFDGEPVAAKELRLVEHD